MRKILVALVVSTLAIAACGGGGSSKNTKTKTGSNSSGSSSFDQLYNQRSNATIKVTYQNLDQSGKAGDSFTVAQQGKDKTAYVTGDSEVIVNGDTVTNCSNLQNTPDCTATTNGAAAAQAAVAGLTGLLTAAQTQISAWATAGGVGDQSTETVAGRTAQCVKITASSVAGKLGAAAAAALAGKNADAGYETCIDKDTGVLLKWVVINVSNDQSGIVASAVTQPTDADFQAPANAKTSTETTEPNSSSAGAGGGGGSGGSATTTCITLPSGITAPAGMPGVCPG
jgi:hypothetical protein